MRIAIIVFFVLSFGEIVFGGENMKPVWTLSNNKIPAKLQYGKIKREGDKIILENGAAFAVPAVAFADQKNFTVEVTASIQKLIDYALFTVMKKQSDKDTGFSFGMNYRIKPWWARNVASVVNNVYMYSRAIGGTKGPKINTPYTFIVSVRKGFASFYIDGYPVKKCYMEMIPNNNPMWIGRNLDQKQKTMPVTISEVKVYGADYKYISNKEVKSKYPRGVVAGRGWALDVPKIVHTDWPKVLIYGDSISEGYKKYFIEDMRKKRIYVFHCCHFVNGKVPKRVLEEMSSRFKFNVIVFNNGLHSLHWTPDKVSDQEVHNRMRNMVECFKKGAPQAKIFYLLTTPYTAKRPAPDKPVDSLGDKNKTVIRLNTISRQVMKEESIDVIDVYTPLTKHLDWAHGYHYHWNGQAYKLIAGKIAGTIEKYLITNHASGEEK